MATFNIPQADNVELAGPMTEFEDHLIAIKPLARETVNVKTEFGLTPALRVQVVDLDAGGTDGGVRLLFWGTVQRTVLDSTTNAEWTVGRIEQKAQVGDPTKTVYLYTPPDMATIDPEAISNMIDSAVAPF